LSAPDRARLILSKAYTAPRTPIEEVLVSIWTNVLGVEHIGIHNTFLELGGHSLLATRIIARIRAIFQIEFPLRYLFESPTIAQLAGQVEQELRATQGLPLPPLSSRSHEGLLPVSFAQQRLWLLEQMDQGHSRYTITTR